MLFRRGSDVNILVTGATGFIGQHFMKVFPSSIAVVRGSSKTEFVRQFVVESINSTTNWTGAFDNVEVVVHLAGIAHFPRADKSSYDSVNIEGAVKLAKEAGEAGVKRFVFISSIGVNGASTQNDPFLPTSLPNPVNDYSVSKHRAEMELDLVCKSLNMELVVIRPTLVYGLEAPGNFSSLRVLVKCCPILPFGLANNRRHFISVLNLVDLIWACCTHPNAKGQIFLASDQQAVSIKDFTNAIAEGLGKKVIQLPVPVSVMRLVGKLIGKSAMIEQLYGNLEVDSSNIKEVLGWTPPFTMKQAMATLRDSGVKK